MGTLACAESSSLAPNPSLLANIPTLDLNCFTAPSVLLSILPCVNIYGQLFFPCQGWRLLHLSFFPKPVYSDPQGVDNMFLILKGEEARYPD